MSTYTEAHKKYYDTHKEEIFLKYRERKAKHNLEYYHKNKKVILERQKARKAAKLLETIYNQKID